ncbi:TlpA family protein disulfide reductase [Pedobacter sp. UC225_65]|uniref:TlpA family protein disulfide reductase n=1 Tax=Pedobacter sp. UC225_65 TaxID=3350173 RepID=UPI0036717AD4
MKKLSLTLLLLVCYALTFAQQANVKIKFIGLTDQKVFVQLPVDGTTFYPARAERQLPPDHTLKLDFKAGQIANVFVTTTNRKFRFLIEPGQTNITLDLGKKDTASIHYQGSSAKGQLLINARKNAFYQSRASNYLKLDSTAKGVMALIAADQQKELKPYDQLLQQKQISKVFYEAIKTDITFDYTAIAGAIPIQLYFASIRPNSKVVFKQEFKDLWKKVYEDRPFNNLKDLNATEFYYHAQYYSNDYIGMYLPQLKGTWVQPDWNDGNKRLKTSYAGFAANFQGKIKEYLLASFLFNEMLQKDYQEVLVTLFNDFKHEYPKSSYAPLLQPMANEIVKYHEQIKKDFAADQRFVANYGQVNTLDELMDKFKGKTIFVDIWATWCGPCKAEFEYGEGLEKFLKSKGAEMMYISMDKDAVDQQWKDMIKYYQLSGSHIRTNAALQQDLINKLWDGKGYAIPRYLILKDGKLVVPNALRPSDKDKLYEQISKYL